MFRGQTRRFLMVTAAPREAEAVLRGLGAGEMGLSVSRLSATRWRVIAIGPVDVVISGVGKTNAAAATALAFDPGVHGAVLSLGVAGALPGKNGKPAVGLGEVVLGSCSVFADEGAATPEGFVVCREMGFPLCVSLGEDAWSPPGWLSGWLLETLRPRAEAVGPIATVSACSGTDAAALGVGERTGAVAEAMEGAAVGLVVANRMPGAEAAPFAEVRVISNTTGDRGKQRWELERALKTLEGVARGVAGL